ncbi:uncharacterized protein LOC131954931 [Physella acuta]|uniref:uncharacterized protein LOC131954931 n=1 Tax=Physella acuta TaxID=109671 RepID=UPI0027DB1656|nr:uncharacterized protein LOC131954931 [Physella acuta]
MLVIFELEDTAPKVTLNFTLPNNTESFCPQLVVYWRGRVRMMLECRNPEYILHLNLTLGGNFSVCRIALNGGRNVALEGTATLYFNKVPVPNRDPSHQPSVLNKNPTGFYIEKRGIALTWELLFEKPRNIYELLLITCRNPNRTMSKFDLEMIDFDNKSVYTYNSTEASGFHHYASGKIYKEIWRIIIRSVDVLSFCGIYAYGDDAACTNP